MREGTGRGVRGGVIAGLVAAGIAACGGNQSGDLAALGQGDVSNPPAPRGRPDEALVAACGDGAATGAGAAGLQRGPYLQQVTERSALLLWTAPEVGAATVELTTPAGAPLGSVAGRVDAGVGPGAPRQLVAALEGLAPATIYCYRLLADGLPMTARAGFRTAPAAGADAPVAFAVLGDSGDPGSDQDAVTAQLESVPFDLLLHVGDLAYPSGSRGSIEAALFVPYRRLLQSLPLFPASGNHEYDTADAAPFREVFALPDNGGPEGLERWYSFDWGPVHFVALDTERVGPAQLAWLDADLAASAQPWLVVYGHRPAYSSGEHGSDRAMQRDLVPILEAHDVDLVLAGHDHDYERTLPLRGGEVAPGDGIPYVVTGGGGRGTRAVGRSAFTAYSEAVLELLFVTIDGDDLRLHAIDATGREFDSLVAHRRQR